MMLNCCDARKRKRDQNLGPWSCVTARRLAKRVGIEKAESQAGENGNHALHAYARGAGMCACVQVFSRQCKRK